VDVVTMQTIYENLVWYNGTCATCTIPWLANSYTNSPDFKTWNFTLRQNINFVDGEPLNSSAVYFSLNRLLVDDGSIPTGHALSFAYEIQQLLNFSLSGTWCECSLSYNTQFVNDVLNQNFVQITGPYSFTLHLIHPNSALPYLLSAWYSAIMAPKYVMQKDVTLWKQSSNQYSLPYPTLSGNSTTQIKQYLYDLASTCNSGVTPGGCGASYIQNSGPSASTGPYYIVGWDHTTNVETWQSNPNYWGGAWATKIKPGFKTIVLKNIVDSRTRVLDLQSAARSGQAMSVDVTNDHLSDVADRNAWLNQKRLVSTLPGVTIYGPEPVFSTIEFLITENVTNPTTGKPYTFQPFADRRFRLAFSEAANLTALNADVNNNLGSVAVNAIPPGIPPAGSFNASIKPAYSYNPDDAAKLLLDAMQHPLTKFRFYNGTAAPPGYFNNTFGCRTLGSSGTCAGPVAQSISIDVISGFTFDAAIAEQIASTLDNISSTYNMGLTVNVLPLPLGPFVSQAFGGNFYFYELGGWQPAYPYVIDMVLGQLKPGSLFPAIQHINLPIIDELYKQMISANAAGNITGVIKADNKINEIANQYVFDYWTFYPSYITAMTSNVKGYFFNEALWTETLSGNAFDYLGTLYPVSS
jgi:ABC-type transport system substrate-binding protein